MELGRSELLALLIFCYQVTWAAGEQITVREGDDIQIKCQPEVPNKSNTIWFRVLDNAGMEFIATFDFRGEKKKTPVNPTIQFDSSRITSDILTLKSFKKADSGAYGCAVYESYMLKFGKVQRLVAETVATPQPTVAATTAVKNECTTAAPCTCDEKGIAAKGKLDCTPLILGPLAGGCGLLLLILIITSLYCNKIRTRRCPHHHKRKPRMMPGGPK